MFTKIIKLEQWIAWLYLRINLFLPTVTLLIEVICLYVTEFVTALKECTILFTCFSQVSTNCFILQIT